MRLLHKSHSSVSGAHLLPMRPPPSCSHVCASCLVLTSTRLYIAGLSLPPPHTLSGCLCYWKSEEWALHFEYAALSRREEREPRPGRKKGKRPERKKAPLTTGRTPVSPCPPLSPLSPECETSANGRNLERGRTERRESAKSRGLCLGRWPQTR